MTARVLVPYLLGIAFTASGTALACFAYLKRPPPEPEQCVESVEIVLLGTGDEKRECPGGWIEQWHFAPPETARWAVHCHCGERPQPKNEPPDASVE